MCMIEVAAASALAPLAHRDLRTFCIICVKNALKRVFHR